MLTTTPPDQTGIYDQITVRPPTRRTPRTLVVSWLLGLAAWAANTADTLRSRAAAARADESGNVITDNLAWIVFGVVAIVAIGALIKTLGSDVLNWVQNQLGID